MVYYGRNDISVGEFLLRYCFRPFYRCQSCGVDMLKHQRHVIHGGCGLHITMQQLDGPLQDSSDEGVSTWLACRHCDQACTPYTRMSENSLRYSFAKFIELKFHCDTYTTRFLANTTCDHSLHKDYVQYFSHKNKIVAFQPSSISMLEVYLPPRTVEICTPHSEYHHDYASEIKQLQRVIEGVFYRIKQRLCSYQMEPVTSLIPDHIANSKVEREALRNKVKILKDLAVSAGFLKSSVSKEPQESCDHESEEENLIILQDGVEELKRSISEVVECWNINLEGLDSAARTYRHRREQAHHETVSPRESPINIITQQATDNTAVTGSGGGDQSSNAHSTTTTIATQQQRSGAAYMSVTPCSTPPSNTPVNLSPDLSHSSGRTSDALSDSSQRSSTHYLPQSLQVTTVLASTGTKKSHSRHLSDSGIHQSEGGKNNGILSEAGKSHRRQLSDSTTAVVSSNRGLNNIPRSAGGSNLDIPPVVAAAASEALASENTRSNRSTKSEERESISLEDRSSYSKSGSSGSEVVVNSDGASFSGNSTRQTTDSAGNERGKQLGTNYLSVKSKGESSHGPVAPPTSGHAPSQEDDVALPDSSSGIFAKRRGKEQEDPLKYYLWDPSEIAAQGSPVLSGAMAHISPGPTPPPPPSTSSGKTGPRRTSGNPKRTAANSASALTDNHTEGKGIDRRQQREKATLLSRPFQRLPTPFEHTEHHNMHGALRIPIAIYDNEPTSIIAFALSSQQYQQDLQAIRDRKLRGVFNVGTGGGVARSASGAELKPTQNTHAKQQLKRQVSDTPATKNSFKAAFNELRKKGSAISLFSFSTSMSIDQSADRSSDPFEKSDSRRFETSTASVKSYEGGQTSKTGDAYDSVASSGLQGGDDSDSPRDSGHISLEFTAPDKSASFFCKVYFAEDFHKLRERIFPSGEDRFIRSLARCVKYDAKGGKSRSAFCKVADDRFILKQIKSIEIQSLEQFAPHYFEYVTKALDEMRPLALAKIVGVYSMGYRNTKTGNSKRIDVIVMENLLYGRKSAKVFDLKGSMRSRYVDPSKDSSGDVLLDENYLNYICYSPMYVYPHSKCVLMQALLADSEFLAKHSVMDYSLLTCIDESSGELVVGIIDYVRTFTLDKRLEMYLKKTAGRTLPTIVYPEQYQKRFCDAMERYFTVVPDKWTGLGMDVKFYE